jgi:hypothetical protein
MNIDDRRPVAGAARHITRARTRAMRRATSDGLLRAAAIGAALVAIAACAGQPPLHSQLDEAGRTWLSADAPVSLSRPAPRFSRAARDYLYLAPVETNNGGTRRHYLWVGLGTTVDRRWPWAAAPEAQKLLLVLDGTPLFLPLEPWDAQAGAGLYRPPAPTYAVRRASVSLDELTRIAAASSVEAQVVMRDGAVDAYELWSGNWSDWSAFVAGAAGERPLGASR